MFSNKWFVFLVILGFIHVFVMMTRIITINVPYFIVIMICIIVGIIFSLKESGGSSTFSSEEELLSKISTDSSRRVKIQLEARNMGDGYMLSFGSFGDTIQYVMSVSISNNKAYEVLLGDSTNGFNVITEDTSAGFKNDQEKAIEKARLFCKRLEQSKVEYTCNPPLPAQ